MTTTPRCSVASARDDEPLEASAPTDARWLLVEHPGPWGAKAVASSRLPEEVRTHLARLGHDGVRVQLVRRHGAEGAVGRLAGPQVIAADLSGGEVVVRRTLLDDVRALPTLDLATMPRSDEPVLAVCTNGARDLCCAETGRPVAAALAAQWPEATWETTHLGGHRFAGTLLALPSGVVLGRLRDAGLAVDAVAALLDGRLPQGRVRGRAGLAAPAQAAEHHVRAEWGLHGLDDVRVLAHDAPHDAPADAPTDAPGAQPLDVVRLRAAGRDVVVDVAAEPGPARAMSCADTLRKPTVLWRCRTRPDVARDGAA